MKKADCYRAAVGRYLNNDALLREFMDLERKHIFEMRELHDPVFNNLNMETLGYAVRRFKPQERRLLKFGARVKQFVESNQALFSLFPVVAIYDLAWQGMKHVATKWGSTGYG